jgi:nucleoside-diphosphate-sugar epimerase
MIGGNTALHLRNEGHEVVLMSRRPPVSPLLEDFEFIAGDYTAEEGDSGLEGFEGLVFSAAADIRNVPTDGSVTPEDFYQQVNNVAVPRFFERAQRAGMSRAVYIGSFYPQVAPHRIEVCPYVRSRHETDEAVRAMSRDGFSVCSVNAPFVLGYLPGLPVPHLDALVKYVRGELGLPLFAPEGGTNHITSTSVAEAVAGALARGEPGTPYLVGDENYSWKAYLEAWCAAAGKPAELEVRAEDHPMLPNAIMFAGVGATVSYEPDADETALLGYGRDRVASMIEEVVRACDD